MNKTSPSLAIAEPRPANLAQIEADLAELWHSMGEGEGTRGAVTRACALTLLVYVESEGAGCEVSNLISAVTAQNPCRAVVMIAEPEAALPALMSWISAHCHLPTGGEKQVCCEQITVQARGESMRDLDNLVVPLAVPGLPVVLWWRAGRFAPPDEFRQILRITNRVFVDSARFPEPAADLTQLSRQIHRLSGEVTISDLNWSRATPWRELIAQSFDSAESRSYLDRLSRVRIEYEERSPRVGAQGAQALLLAGWLASRLKWEPQKPRLEQRKEVRPFLFKSPTGLVEVQRVARSFEGGGCGVCFSIILEAGGEPRATFSFQRGPDGRNTFVRREISGRSPVEGTARLQVLDEAELVNEEMKFAGRDCIYEEALGIVARMAEA